ncbi:MAG: polysaccharide biosynthesis tyrosine autokinase [Gemmatimonadaceae bacterium]
MSGNTNHPVAASSAPVEVFSENAELANWSPTDVPPPSTGPNIQRYVSALSRFKWLIIILTMIGGAGGVVATRFIEPEYEVESNITVDASAGGASGQAGGPIVDANVLDRASWTDLLKSYSVADPVVLKLKLYIEPDNNRDSVLFRDFNVTPGLIGGEYALKTEGRNWKLLVNNSMQVDSGAVGDSVGLNRGFQWQPSAQMLAEHKSVGFTIETPREASRDLIARLQQVQGLGKSPFLRLLLTGKNSVRLAATLNAWTEQFVSEAFAMKKTRVTYMSTLLAGQREYAAEALSDAERALEDFRVKTVTEPNERQQAIVGGLSLTTPTVMTEFFSMSVSVQNLQRDRANLEKLLSASKETHVALAPEAILSIPSVNTDPAAGMIKQRLQEQNQAETNVRKLQETRTDKDPAVVLAQATLDTLKSVMVPRELGAYIEQLKIKEAALNQQIAASGASLQDIPKRTIQEMQLTRAANEAEQLFTGLDRETHKARLAEAATMKDITVRDTAVAPSIPSRNTAPLLIGGAIGAAFALGIVLAILLDQTDKRFRYPEQATNDLGLYILGVVPVIGGKGRRGAEQAAQVVETFRSIRMNVRYATEPGRALTLTITSPGPNDGKSLISSNLALSFSEAGARTLLIDGDIRRGELSKTFGTSSKPGLVEYLDGTALIDEVLQPTASHPNLTIMPGGARRRRAPELLATPKLPQLIAQLSREYDVIIVDSPPLGAGFDAFALATATMNMAIVLRAGITDRKLAKAKLATVDQLPIRVIGTVLNSIKLAGAYQYYSYYQDYAAQDEEPVSAPRISARGEGANMPVPVSRE